MKRILIVSHTMELGGAERALLGLLEHIDFSAYNVDLFLLHHQGELMKYIPEEVNLLPEDPFYSCLAVPIKEVIRKGKFDIVYHRWLGKEKAKKRVKELGVSSDNAIGLEYSHKFTKNRMPVISNEEYDLAISFLTPHYFVLDKVKAKKKIAWVHTDYSKVTIDVESEYEMWNGYDHIVAVSEGVAQQFLILFPSLKNKVCVIENMLSERLIYKQASEPIGDVFKPENVNLLSVGRFSHAKNFDQIPAILQFIHKEIPNAVWYLIGYGGDEPLIREEIHKHNMNDAVIILGKKENPYPYINACNLYIQPSRYEGKAVAVREAQTLGKPVVITEYKTSSSQLADGVDGVIVPIDSKNCAAGIVRLLQDKEKMKKLAEQCKINDYTNRNEIYKLYNLIESDENDENQRCNSNI